MNVKNSVKYWKGEKCTWLKKETEDTRNLCKTVYFEVSLNHNRHRGIFYERKWKEEKKDVGEKLLSSKVASFSVYAPKEAKIMIIEPRGVVNTGNKKDMLTAPNDAWI